MLTKKIAIAAGALTLAAGGVAAAAGSPPEEAEKGLTIAEEQVGADLPASGDARPGATPEVPEPEVPETEPEDDIDELEALDEGEGEEAPPEGTHGATVAAVAQSDEHEGRAHGEAVSEVARDNHGAEAREDDDASAGAAEQGQGRAEEARAAAPAGRP